MFKQTSMVGRKASFKASLGEEPDPETQRPRDPETQRPRDPETQRPRDPETQKLRDPERSEFVSRNKSTTGHDRV
jgi:hypothetical protein